MNEKNIRPGTAESVRAGHPDKLCDQIADAILDAHLRQDPNARVAVEVFATAGKIIVGGEITSKAKVSYDKIVAGVINRIGYTMSDLCGDPHGLLELEVCLHEQSPDISAAVSKTGLDTGDAGDVGKPNSARAIRALWWAMPPAKRKNTCPCPWYWRIASVKGWTS